MSLSGDTAGLLGLSLPPGPDCSGRVIQSSLSTLRRHLGMEVGFVGRFVSGCRVFEYVDAAAADCPVKLRGSDPTGQTYCGRVAEGLLPGLIPDAAAEPGVADLAITERLGIGAYMSVPLRRSGGEVIGTICCFSHTPDHSLRDRDLALMQLFADLVTLHLESMLSHEEAVGRVRRRVREVIEDGGPAIAVQPIVAIETGQVVGYEALSRFSAAAGAWNPQQWFDEACRAGVAAELEASAVRNALPLLSRLPDGTSLSVNVSGAALAHPEVLELLLEAATPRLVVEITEQVPVEDYLAVAEPISLIRAAGGRVAVDDAGSGYAGLRHILQLRPEVVKLDRSLVAGLVDDPARRAMIAAMVGFARHMEVDLVAEGVESAPEASALAELGVNLGQGYHFGRPSTALSEAGPAQPDGPLLPGGGITRADAGS